MSTIPANVELKTGDLFTSTQPAIGHGVNVDGDMSGGLARIVQRRYPEVYEAYRAVCVDGRLQPGQMLPVLDEDGTWWLNLASQDRPGRHARLEWFEQALAQSFRFAQFKKLPGFAIPRIGAGIGGLDWEDVFEVIISTASDFAGSLLG